MSEHKDKAYDSYYQCEYCHRSIKITLIWPLGLPPWLKHDAAQIRLGLCGTMYINCICGHTITTTLALAFKPQLSDIHWNKLIGAD
jgi:hypothetical protein